MSDATNKDPILPNDEDPPELTTEKDTSPPSPRNSDSPVLVEAPEALQIISIGTEEDQYAFEFDQAKLDRILSKIPDGTPVAVVSVVGAFRTGKSFVLSFFLKYLNALDPVTGVAPKDWYQQLDSLENTGFDWKAGSERNTTGIWMWSHPTLVQGKAIILVDTQGMFDHETTMALTASIFGMGTLMSSYQIYNVDKRIQEDNLQQLVLFTEYAKVAMQAGATAASKDEEPQKPFQKMDFLVRDWQHFEEEDDVELMAEEMQTYLKTVIEDRDAQDLQETREQIHACFESIDCFGLVHPGFAVTKKKYDGTLADVEPTFLKLLDLYCRRVFSSLEPKRIHGQALTAQAFGTYVEAYAGMFQDGAAFPEAATMLDATAHANNTNAVQEALKAYKEIMDRTAGPHCSNFMRPEELKEGHKHNKTLALELFEARANFGSTKSIEKSRRDLETAISEKFEMYEKLNESRNPLFGLEIYMVPFAVAGVAFLVKAIIDWTCSLDVCVNSSAILQEVRNAGLCFLAILAMTRAKQIMDVFERFRRAVQLMTDSGGGGSGTSSNANAKPKQE